MQLNYVRVEIVLFVQLELVSIFHFENESSVNSEAL